MIVEGENDGGGGMVVECCCLATVVMGLHLLGGLSQVSVV